MSKIGTYKKNNFNLNGQFYGINIICINIFKYIYFNFKFMYKKKYFKLFLKDGVPIINLHV